MNRVLKLVFCAAVGFLVLFAGAEGRTDKIIRLETPTLDFIHDDEGHLVAVSLTLQHGMQGFIILANGGHLLQTLDL